MQLLNFKHSCIWKMYRALLVEKRNKFLFQMSYYKCNWMLVASSTTTGRRLFTCTGNYNWQSYDVTGTNIDQPNPGTTLGMNYLQHCWRNNFLISALLFLHYLCNISDFKDYWQHPQKVSKMSWVSWKYIWMNYIQPCIS